MAAVAGAVEITEVPEGAIELVSSFEENGLPDQLEAYSCVLELVVVAFGFERTVGFMASMALLLGDFALSGSKKYLFAEERLADASSRTDYKGQRPKQLTGWFLVHLMYNVFGWDSKLINLVLAGHNFKMDINTTKKYIRSTDPPLRSGAPGEIPDGAKLLLVGHLQRMCRCGVYYSPRHIQRIAGRMKATYKANEVKRGRKSSSYEMPSPSWVSRFMASHKFTMQKPGTLDKGRDKVTRLQLYEWYVKLAHLCKEFDIVDPRQMHNMDESGLIINREGQHDVYNFKGRIDSSSDFGAWSEEGRMKFNQATAGCRSTTTLATWFCADGSVVKLDHLTKGTRLEQPPALVTKFTKRAKVLRTQTINGKSIKVDTLHATPRAFQTRPSFARQFKEWAYIVREKSIEAGHPDEWHLLIYDNHTSHFSEEVIAAVIEKKIIILTIPPHSSHIIQPFDVAPAGSWKAAVRALISDASLRARAALSKDHAPALAAASALNAFTVELVQKSFKLAGWWDFGKGCPVAPFEQQQSIMVKANIPEGNNDLADLEAIKEAYRKVYEADASDSAAAVVGGHVGSGGSGAATGQVSGGGAGASSSSSSSSAASSMAALDGLRGVTQQDHSMSQRVLDSIEADVESKRSSGALAGQKRARRGSGHPAGGELSMQTGIVYIQEAVMKKQVDYYMALAKVQGAALEKVRVFAEATSAQEKATSDLLSAEQELIQSPQRPSKKKRVLKCIELKDAAARSLNTSAAAVLDIPRDTDAKIAALGQRPILKVPTGPASGDEQ